MSALDDRLRSAANAIHQQTEGLSIPADLDDPERVVASRTRLNRLLVTLAAAVVVALVASVAVGLTRRGSDGSGGGALSIEALAKATQKESAHLTLTFIFSSSNSGDWCVEPEKSKGPQECRLTFDGVVDFRRKTARIDLMERNSTVGALKRIGTALEVDGRVFESVPGGYLAGQVAELPRTKRWIESHPNDSSGSSFFADLSPFDPLALFRGHFLKVDDLGMTRLRGEDVHHYRGTERTTYDDGGVNGPVDVYVDRQNRLVRISGVTHYSDGSTSGGQADFSDFGVRVHVNAPPADQVVQESDLPPG
jgi:hypothetical protein